MLYRRDLYGGEKGGFGIGKTKRGKGAKLIAVTDDAGIPLAVHATSASPHEVTLVLDTLKERFLRQRPRRLIGNRAYDCDPLDKTLAQQNFAWSQNYRRGLVRYDYHLENFLGFVHLACILIFMPRCF
jgi:hypothetical protein